MKRHRPTRCIICNKKWYEENKTDKGEVMLCCGYRAWAHHRCWDKENAKFNDLLRESRRKRCILCGKRHYWYKSEKIILTIFIVGFAFFFARDVGRIQYPESHETVATLKIIGFMFLILLACVILFILSVMYQTWGMYDGIDDEEDEDEIKDN